MTRSLLITFQNVLKPSCKVAATFQNVLKPSCKVAATFQNVLKPSCRVAATFQNILKPSCGLKSVQTRLQPRPICRWRDNSCVLQLGEVVLCHRKVVVLVFSRKSPAGTTFY